MEQKTHLIHRSGKTVKDLNEVVGEKKFLFPFNLANDCSPEGKSSIMVQINSKKTYVICGEETMVDEDVFALLKDVGLVSSNETYEVGGPFDPVRNHDQR